MMFIHTCKYSMRIYFILFAVIFSRISTASPLPDLSAWLTEINRGTAKSSITNSINIPNRIMLIKSWENRFYPKLFEIENKDTSGTIDFASKAEVELSYHLNFWPGGKKSMPLPLEKRTLLSMTLLRCDSAIILSKDPNNPWRFVHKNNSNVDLNIKIEPPTDPLNDKSVRKWLGLTLGYNGVVLDTKQEYVLVASLFDAFDGTARQGLALKNSQSKIRIKDDNDEGSGLLTYTAGIGNYAIFKIVFLEQGVTELPRGSKLVLEKLDPN
ncbi:MAG: hypothetical protein R3B45_00720 [Bdellovibrionota bacterium]